jgi:23S rRNA (cytidine1920-2'-O)/16S rRNA (cytidine1409-2'-O)-methyltransferase
MGKPEPAWASRAASKLAAALDAFGLDVDGLVCADLGCHAGGFTDCLLRRGASRVYAVDTGYGVLSWRLRQDPRVVVMERSNALHVEPPRTVDLVTIDVGWTRQRHVIPAALRWLGPGASIVSLVKPHYELDEADKARLMHDGVLAAADAEVVFRAVLAELPSLGVRVEATVESPITGAKSARRAASDGNHEYLVLAFPDAGERAPETGERAPETGDSP